MRCPNPIHCTGVPRRSDASAGRPCQTHPNPDPDAGVPGRGASRVLAPGAAAAAGALVRLLRAGAGLCAWTVAALGRQLRAMQARV